MFRFLYLFGPGVLSWLIYSRYSRKEGFPQEWKTMVWMPVEITACKFCSSGNSFKAVWTDHIYDTAGRDAGCALWSDSISYFGRFSGSYWYFQLQI